MNLRKWTTHIPLPKCEKRLPSPALKSKGNVTRNPQQRISAQRTCVRQGPVFTHYPFICISPQFPTCSFTPISLTSSTYHFLDMYTYHYNGIPSWVVRRAIQFLVRWTSCIHPVHVMRLWPWFLGWVTSPTVRTRSKSCLLQLQQYNYRQCIKGTMLSGASSVSIEILYVVVSITLVRQVALPVDGYYNYKFSIFFKLEIKNTVYISRKKREYRGHELGQHYLRFCIFHNFSR